MSPTYQTMRAEHDASVTLSQGPLLWSLLAGPWNPSARTITTSHGLRAKRDAFLGTNSLLIPYSLTEERTHGAFDNFMHPGPALGLYVGRCRAGANPDPL